MANPGLNDGTSIRMRAIGYGDSVRVDFGALDAGAPPDALGARWFRESPLFPASDTSVVPNSSSFFIGFLAPDNPLKAISSLLANENANIPTSVWYSHGIFSVVIVSESEQTVDAAISECGGLVRAREKWKIVDSCLDQDSVFSKIEAPTSVPNLPQIDSTGLSGAIEDILCEFRCSIRSVYYKSTIFAPMLCASYERLASSVSEIVSELKYFEGIEQQVPLSLPESFEDSPPPPNERRQRANHHIGSLVQINSALSYVASQAFGGAPPILANEAYVHSFSLLGIGTAYRALYLVTRSVERVFEHKPINDVVASQYKTAQAAEIPPFLHHYSPGIWADHPLNLDDILDERSPSNNQSKLVFYSGRLGYRETEFAVTASLQALTGGHTPQWTLLTLTHELMHAHVRALLASILRGDKTKSSLESMPEVYQRFKSYAEDRNENDAPKVLIESLQFGLWNYCQHKLSNVQHATPVVQDSGAASKRRMVCIEPTLSSVGVAPDVMAWAYRELNELIVHVLDFNYFYHSDERVYVRLLWRSWSHVPAVLEEIEHYLLRTIVTIGTGKEGTPEERFSLACADAIGVLEELDRDYPEDVVIGLAIASLKDADAISRLRLQFIPAIFLADMATRFLLAPSIRGEFFDDENVSGDDSSLVFEVEPGSFDVPFDITSPIALVFDQLRRSADNDEILVNRHQQAAWLLLLCASTTTPDARPGNAT